VVDSRIGPIAAVEDTGDDRDPATVIEAVFLSDYARLVALARLLLDRQVEAEEVVQEAFARVLATRRRSGSQAEATAYVQRAVINVCRDGLRRRRVARAVGDPEPWRTGADSTDAAAVAAGASERRAVIAAIRTLPIRQREVVVLRYLAERSTAETAEILGISEGSVKTHLSRGLSALESELETRP
jgi:RNA polymerase sigma-70 factor (sigma-E family)